VANNILNYVINEITNKGYCTIADIIHKFNDDVSKQGLDPYNYDTNELWCAMMGWNNIDYIINDSCICTPVSLGEKWCVIEFPDLQELILPPKEPDKDYYNKEEIKSLDVICPKCGKKQTVAEDTYKNIVNMFENGEYSPYCCLYCHHTFDILKNVSNKDKDLVNHPNHYNHEGRKECWEEMIDLFGMYYTGIFDLLTAYKYFYRAGTKEGNSRDQDVAKMNNYLNHCSELIIYGAKELSNENTSDMEINKRQLSLLATRYMALKHKIEREVTANPAE
jgi:hypothetical protein